MLKTALIIFTCFYLQASDLPILQTGQTKVYEKGDNGTFPAGKERSYSRKGEIVTDLTTGLMWQDDKDTKTKALTWEKAKSYCQNLSLGSYSDWRLPTLKELKTIVDYSRVKPAIDKEFKNVVSNFYWSSSTNAGNSGNAWVVYFKYGDDRLWRTKTNSYYVRCVRGQ